MPGWGWMTAGFGAVCLGLLSISAAQTTNIVTTLVSGLSGPFQLGTDGAGGFIVAVTGSSTYLRGWANGSTTTFATGQGAIWGGAATNGDGGFYYTVNSSRVAERNLSGAVRIAAGTGQNGYTGDGGPGSAATLYQPYGLCEDGAGGIYITDTFNHVSEAKG